MCSLGEEAMKENFDQAFKWLMEHEGPFCDDSALGDAGGMTTWGVTHIDWARWTGHSPSKAEMMRLKQSDVKPLYKKFYWDVMHCDDLPSGVDYAVFDYGVNSGVYKSIKVLQRLVGTAPDGIIGKQTLAAVAKVDPQQLALDICKERLGYLRGLRIFKNFGRGWTRRVAEVESRVQTMA